MAPRHHTMEYIEFIEISFSLGLCAKLLAKLAWAKFGHVALLPKAQGIILVRVTKQQRPAGRERGLSLILKTCFGFRLRSIQAFYWQFLQGVMYNVWGSFHSGLHSLESS